MTAAREYGIPASPLGTNTQLHHDRSTIGGAVLPVPP